MPQASAWGQSYVPTVGDPLTSVISVLVKNKDKNFVQRIFTPDTGPRMENPDGSYSTHRMAWATVDGRPVVYPTIIQDPSTGSLVPLDSRTALTYALKTGEYIPFDKPEEADWFSQSYKKIWGNK